MGDGGKGSAQRPVDYNKFASNYDLIFRRKTMDEETREIDLQLGDARMELDLCKEALGIAITICEDVDRGQYGDALMHTQKFHAAIEAIRQYKAKEIDMDGRC